MDYFGDSEVYNPHLFKNKFKNPSVWVPPNSKLSTETLKTIRLINQLRCQLIYQNKSDETVLQLPKLINLTHAERSALRNLQNNTEITIRSADKGGSIVVMNTSLYNMEVEHQLFNPQYYRPIPGPLYNLTVPRISKVLTQLRQRGLITSKQMEFLGPNNPKSRTFYLLPKIHKEHSKWSHPKMPEGRPIVSCCGSELHPIGRYIDHFLQPIAQQNPVYIKDSYHFISKIRNTVVPSDCLLVTGDITSLYTNMDWDLIIQSITEALITYPDPERDDALLLELIQITLTSNDFKFNGQWFQQILGMPMGNPCSPSTANIFLKKLDQAATHWRILLQLFFRFLDDVFFVWPAGEQELKVFERFLNSIIPNIHITLNVSSTEVNFLDITVFKHINSEGICTLQTKTFFKPTDTHQLLHTHSYHPPHIFKSVIQSQFIRLKRLSSFHSDYQHSSAILCSVLRKRGYSKRLLRTYKNNTWYHFQDTEKDKNHTNILPIVVHYNAIGQHAAKGIRDIISKNSNFNNTRIVTAFKVHKNLGQILSKK